VYCPIDTSLNFGQLNKLLPDLRPKILYIPDKYRKPPAEFALYSESTSYCVQYEPPPVSFRKHQVFSIPYYKKFVKVKVDPDLAAQITFKKVNGVSVSSLAGVLSYYGNRLILEPADGSVPKEKATPFPYGSLDFSALVTELKKNGFSPVEEASPRNRKVLRLEKEKITIELTDANTTHVICEEGGDNTRNLIKEILLQSLPTF